MEVTWWQPLKTPQQKKPALRLTPLGPKPRWKVTLKLMTSGTIMSTWKWPGRRAWCIPYNLWSTCCRKKQLSKESSIKQEHTKTLQSDTTSMSLVVPALFDLLSHLADFAENSRYRDLATLAEKMRSNLNLRFACLLDPTDEKFSPLAAAACFVNPTVCEILVNVDVADGNIQELLKQAEDYVVKCTFLPHTRQEDHQSDDDAEEVIEEPEPAPSSKQPVFRFLSKCRTTRPKQKTSTTSVRQQIIKYKEELSHPITEDTGTDFWLEKSDSFYHSLKPFALDLLAMPASQAFAERVFSITGDLTRGRRNRGRVSLERSAFLKMNRNK
ncbi:uncharacterized protein LOC134869531 isoform X2 [Eleginops maclovinus]|uniref:uncharacterized protein LOC134861446 isoform X2 n=1 Tax=Eleginops maclovinus TaxID=56733 RepID=UPI00307FED32